MDIREVQFINDVLKPWDELNDLLAKPYAYEPLISDTDRMAGNIAIAIKHQCDFNNESRKQIDQLSLSNKVMSDVADMIKHRRLDIKSRENELCAIASFEYFENKFKFLRTIIYVEYRDGKKFDFMSEAAKAISFWISRLNLKISKPLDIKLCTDCFEDNAILYYNPSKCIHMKSTRMQIYRKNDKGALELFSPKEVRLIMCERKE